MAADTKLAEAAPEELRDAVRDRYGALAREPDFDANFPTGRPHAIALGYPEATLDALPASVVEVFAGPGAPVLSADIVEGERILDLGCGAGMDAAIASRLTGSRGWVVGLDSAAEMARRGREGLRADFPDIDLTVGEGCHLPFPDATFDLVIANGILNLEPDRVGLVGEMARVLKPGGRLAGTEVILTEDLDRSDFTVSDWFR